MVNRVFSYSLTAAENNKIKISIPLMILEIFGLVILMTIAIFVVTWQWSTYFNDCYDYLVYYIICLYI